MADWGDIPSWVNSIATIFALVFAAVAAVSARRVYRIESARDRVAEREHRERAESQRKNQAVLVSAWWGAQDVTGGGGTQSGAYVRNASATPVYDARVTVSRVDEPEMSDTIGIATIPPASEAVFYASGQWLADRDWAARSSEFRVEVTFTDSAGVRWIRDKQGQLFELLPELTIWTDSLRVRSLEQASNEFLSSHNVSVAFRCPSVYELRADFLEAVRNGETPDILIGPHDWIAELAEDKMIDPVTLPPRRRAAFVPKAMGAMIWDGKTWGVPYAADSVALLRNLELAPDVPATMEELLAHGRAVCAEGRSDEPLAVQIGAAGDVFHAYPFLVSLGVNLFAPREGTWSAEQIFGPRLRDGMRRLADWGEDGRRVFRREITREKAVELFERGRTPFIICPPWVVGRGLKAGLRFATSPVPPFADGGPTRAPIAVHGFYFPSVGKNKAIARGLVFDFLTRLDIARILHDDQPRTPALVTAFETFNTEDVHSAEFQRQFVEGDLIPSTPGMAKVWTALNKAQADTVGGADVDQVLRDLRHTISRIDA